MKKGGGDHHKYDKIKEENEEGDEKDDDLYNIYECSEEEKKEKKKKEKKKKEKKEKKEEKEALWQNRYIQKMKNVMAGFGAGVKIFMIILIVLIILIVIFFIGYGLYRLGKAIYQNYQTRSAEGLTLMDWITNPIQASEDLTEYGMSFF